MRAAASRGARNLRGPARRGQSLRPRRWLLPARAWYYPRTAPATSAGVPPSPVLMRPLRPFRLALAAVALATVAPALPAQLSAPLASPLPFPPNRASVNLLGIPFGIGSAEYERFTSEEVSFGAAAGVDENAEKWLEGKVRYYPSGRGARGLAVGMSAGIAQIRAFTNEDCFIVCGEAGGPLGTGFTVGAVLDYSWLLGRRERFYVGTGVGAKRVFGLSDEETADGTESYREVLPSFRLQTGFVF